MRVISLTVLLGLTLFSPAAAADGSVIRGPVTSLSGPLFSQLFAPSTPLFKPSPPNDGNAGSSNLLPARPLPRIVCGMKVVPVDPSFDAKIRRPVPSGKKFTIRTSKPPICGQ